MKKRPRKEVCIEVLVSEMRNGSTHAECLAKYSSKWHYPNRTFSNHWKEAQEVYNDERREVNDKVKSVRIKAEKEVVKRDVMGRLDILERLTKIANGDVVVTRAGDHYEPTQAEQIRAMETINKMQGYNEAEKLDVTAKDFNIKDLVKFE